MSEGSSEDGPRTFNGNVRGLSHQHSLPPPPHGVVAPFATHNPQHVAARLRLPSPVVRKRQSHHTIIVIPSRALYVIPPEARLDLADLPKNRLLQPPQLTPNSPNGINEAIQQGGSRLHFPDTLSPAQTQIRQLSQIILTPIFCQASRVRRNTLVCKGSAAAFHPLVELGRPHLLEA